MAFQCEPQHTFGDEYCLTRCPARAAGVFELVRVEREADRPRPDPRAIDVSVLDMNHGWPNVGHDAIVMAIQTIACDVREALAASQLRVRAVSYDVRRSGQIPPRPTARGGIYVGTGGPGHLDPRRNDGVSEGSQGILEDPSWEAPLFALFHEIHENNAAALLGVCHTFGVMCRWLGVAEPVLRGPDKGGKSAGIVDNILTSKARTHTWFRHLAEESRDGSRISILDNRLYDLIPTGAWTDVLALSYETGDELGACGESLTMMEVAAAQGEAMPRILAVNHHPEVVNRSRLLTLLWQKRARGEVSHAWYEERARAMTQTLRDEASDRGLDLTSRYTFFEPLRFHIYQQVRRRAEALGEPIDLDEASVLDWAAASRAARL
jgi:hypothetical protein